MNQKQKAKILEKAKAWMRDELIPAHRRNTLKLTSVKKFKTNPFLRSYLAYFLEGNDQPENIAKALIYPRVLGTSINTSFGQRVQGLMTKIFEGITGSQIPGIDLEFTDKIDGRRKYCQLKAGPDVINHDDVESITNHFQKAARIGRTNNQPIQMTDYMFCLLYGEAGQENSFIKQLKKNYVVVMGQEFWHRFTGDPDFYQDLIHSMGEVAIEVNMKADLKKVIKKLSKEIEQKNNEMHE